MYYIMPDNNNQKQLRGKDELFSQGAVFEASDEELMHALEELSNGHVANDMVRHREVIRGITINAMLNQHHIDKIESRNTRLTRLIVILTIVSILLSVLTFFK